MKVIITKDDKRFIVKDSSKDFHTHLGIVTKEILEKEFYKDENFTVFTKTSADVKMKRGAAIVLPKDAGYIIATTGLNKDCTVLDAGSGSGALAIHLANTAKHVFTYEINEKHYKQAKQNIEDNEIQNITIKDKDFSEANEKADLICLDMPQPWDYLETVDKCLKNSGYLVTYLPTTTQVQQIVEHCKLRHIKTIELIEREWHIEGRRVRPKSQMIAHTAFLSFFRKV